jgi:acetylornithine deacetylase/succinyl-diaminopimelate desuccinylase-like protein
VIPSESELLVDGRILPGQGVQSFMDELRKILKIDCNIEVIDSEEPMVSELNTELFDVIKQVIQSHDSESVVIPSIVTGTTDAKHLRRFGTVAYGFSPMKLKRGESFVRMFHGKDERISLEALLFGCRVLYEVVEKFCCR